MILANHGIVSSSGGINPLNIGLVSMYKAENNANDSLGTYNGTAQGGLTYSTGKSGNAFTFNGTNAYIDYGDVLDVGTSSWTYSVWFNTSDILNEIMLFTKTFAGSSSGRLWASTYNYRLRFNFQALTNIISVETAYGTIAVDTWYNAVFVIDRADRLKIYINGVLQSITVTAGTNDLTPYTSDNFNNNHPFRIGSYTSSDNTTPLSFFNGKIDEIGIWNRALTQSEITELQTKYYPF